MTGPEIHLHPEFPAASFREFLQRELLRRCKKSSRYSLRAFARFLDLDSAELSKILAGKRAISPRMFEKLSRRLGLAPEECERLRPARLNRNRSGEMPEAIATPDYRQLSLDLFQVIADWYHYAILELTWTEGFKGEARWIARRLGIAPAEVNVAVERLKRLGMLEISAEGRWNDTSESTSSAVNDFTDAAMRKLQRQVLEGALHALDNVPVELRSQSSMTMAVNSRLLLGAKERIRRFRRELCAYLKSEEPLDQVYHLGVSLYPVTNVSLPEGVAHEQG